jgi:hypothetical protein
MLAEMLETRKELDRLRQEKGNDSQE